LIIVISLMTTVKPAHAAGVVSPVVTSSWLYPSGSASPPATVMVVLGSGGSYISASLPKTVVTWPEILLPGFPLASEILPYWDSAFPTTLPFLTYWGDSGFLQRVALTATRQPNNTIKIGATYAAPPPYTSDGFNTATGIVGLTLKQVITYGAVSVCPANSAGTPCICNTGYQPDTTATSCVPVVACPVSDLPPVTDPEVQVFENNPDLSDTARLTPRMQTALSCLLTAAAGGSPSVGSAYRPPAYNQHLIDVWEKWVNQLMDDETPACTILKAKIQGHFQRHGLLVTQSPVPNSRHTRGLAVDVTISLPPANIDALARGCGLYRPLPITDRVHFQFP